MLSAADLNSIKGKDVVGYKADREYGGSGWRVVVTARVRNCPSPVMVCDVRAPSHVQALRLINAWVSRK